jgi:glycosyltransferase involved in cell wall biosynthesis
MLSPWALGQKALKKKIALVLAHRRMLNRADFIHVLNNDELERAQALNLRSPFQIIPNGASIEEFDALPNPGEFRKTFPVVGEDPFLLYLGRLHPLKGLDLLTDAFDILSTEFPDLHLVVVGPDAGAEPALRQQVGRLGLANRVHIVGPQYGHNKHAALRDAMCFCLASHHEAFSIAITEALACRLPVVVTRQCNFPEIAEVGAGDVVDLDAGQIAGALRRIATDPDLRHRMGKAGRALVESRFTWQRVAQRSIEAYEQAIASTHS